MSKYLKSVNHRQSPAKDGSVKVSLIAEYSDGFNVTVKEFTPGKDAVIPIVLVEAKTEAKDPNQTDLIDQARQVDEENPKAKVKSTKTVTPKREKAAPKKEEPKAEAPKPDPTKETTVYNLEINGPEWQDTLRWVAGHLDKKIDPERIMRSLAKKYIITKEVRDALINQ
tara:strand:- start:7169 stop:7675 length:507 start_codon:yes stop_codon:yes gene_type:complete